MSNLLPAQTNDSIFTLLSKQNQLLGGTGAGTGDNEFTLLARNNGLLGAGGGGSDPTTTVLYYRDEFDMLDVSGGTPGVNGPSWTGAASPIPPPDANHWGVWKLAPGQNLSWAWWTNSGAQATNNFRSLSKIVLRGILMADHVPEAGTSEWYLGFYDHSALTANNPCGALFSQAQGYTGLPLANGGSGNVIPTPGLLAGTYDGLGGLGYLQSGFTPVANVWMDLIVVWTPTACRFYAATEGSAPALVATITTNVPHNLMPFPQLSNNTSGTNVSIDRAELWVYVNTPGNQIRYVGAGGASNL